VIVADASWVIALRDPGDAHHRDASLLNDQTTNESIILHQVTLAECLVAPAKLGVLDDAATALRAAFDIADTDDDAPVRWASLRAVTGLRLPDVIVLDTAIRSGARAIITFDESLASKARERGLDVNSAAP